MGLSVVKVIKFPFFVIEQPIPSSTLFFPSPSIYLSPLSPFYHSPLLFSLCFHVIYIIGVHLPVSGNCVLLNPETMKVIGVAIACPVVVSRGLDKGVNQTEEGVGGSNDSVYVCCKVWPLASLPLDGKSTVMYCVKHFTTSRIRAKIPFYVL